MTESFGGRKGQPHFWGGTGGSRRSQRRRVHSRTPKLTCASCKSSTGSTNGREYLKQLQGFQLPLTPRPGSQRSRHPRTGQENSEKTPRRTGLRSRLCEPTNKIPGYSNATAGGTCLVSCKYGISCCSLRHLMKDQVDRLLMLIPL